MFVFFFKQKTAYELLISALSSDVCSADLVTKLTLMLNELRLPTIKQLWPTFAERSDKEGWPAARFLSALTEHEIAERGRRRMERHLAEAKLLPGKTLDTFDFDAVPMISKAQVMAIRSEERRGGKKWS